MYRFKFNGTDNINQFEELIKVFLQPSEYEIGEPADLIYEFKGNKDEVKRRLYTDLVSLTNKRPKWGILTGIRPVKLASEIAKEGDPKKVLMNDYYLHENKADLTTEILKCQKKITGEPAKDSISIYIGIPFCPTRCMYCSFTSNQVPDSEIEKYLVALNKEIEFCGELLQETGHKVESLYFGGGTPTTLSAEQLDALLGKTAEAFDLSGLKEYTVEAGRPDTITEERIDALLKHGVDRISINPQTMKEKTLELIGRRHTIDDVYKAFEIARICGVPTINADLIAGLPEETFDDFANSVETMTLMGADNITLHTLAVKRASKLKEIDENFNYKDEILREEMLIKGHEILREHGFRPYYLYRQKHTSGNTENTGFCKNNKASVYNIRIMEEKQTILALGAGGISKVYYPEENRLERIANVSNYQIYIERIDEMIERKRTGGIVNVN